MPPYQQTYEETFEIEKENFKRDVDILNQISDNKYKFFEADNIELQYEGVDFLGIPKDAPLDVWKYIFIDRKTSNKYDKRKFITFELYYQYGDGDKKESWSLKVPNNKENPFLIVFIDREQVISVSKRNMINSLRVLEEIRPDLIKVTEEYNAKGKRVKKHIVSLPINHAYVKSMKPNIYHKFDVNGEDAFIKIN
jgi:hypothetical protein